MTVREGLDYAAKFLSEFTDEALNESKILISYLTDENIGSLPFSNKSVDKNKLDDLILRRKNGEPIQYIIGTWWFYKGEFFVGKGVLIPRQDTETLVETAKEFLKGKKDIKVADLCSGSGCIAISIATDYPEAEVVAIEKYNEAFSYLKKNIEHNGTHNVKPVLADVLEEQSGEFDLIVSNPPYITKAEMNTLSKEVKNEPETALFGGEDGLCFYREIIKKWKGHIKSGGMIAFEVGIGQADAVAEILNRNGYINMGVKKDLCGAQRVVFGTVNNI